MTKFRSKLEERCADLFSSLGVSYEYESTRVPYEIRFNYTPDFVLNNGIIIETKGRFLAIDRRKHLAIKKQHPKLDIRFVFENSRRKLRKGAKSTYAEWCMKYDFKFHDRIIPEEWIKETGKNKHPKFITFPNKKLRR